jgi:hypothetical protein
MKIYELKKGDHFTAKLYDSENENKKHILTISGIYIGMDGMYAKAEMYGIPGITNLVCDLDVTKILHDAID